MLTVTVQVDADAWEAQGVKEALAMYLERFGRSKVILVQPDKQEQLRMDSI